MDAIAEARSLKKELDLLRPLSKDEESRIMQKFRLDWNYHSNHLEGNTLSYGETRALILFNITAQGKPLKDHLEITGHNEAVLWILEVVKDDRPLNETFIRELHKLILKEPYEVDAITADGKPTKKKISVGDYKKQPNHVKTQTGEIFRFASPEETPAKMADLIEWYRKEAEREDVSPILLAAEFHYKYIRIHPFDDGNGRTARILMNFILLKFGYPPVIIKTEDKANYFAALQLADAGTITPFVEYIAGNLVDSLELMIKGAKGESIEEPDDVDKEIALLEQRMKGVGEDVKLQKTDETILTVYNDSLVPLFRYFIQKNRRLGEFYLNTQCFLSFDGTGTLVTDFEPAQFHKELLEAKRDLQIRFLFRELNKKKFKSVHFDSILTIKFKYTTFSIERGSDDQKIEKYYDQTLSQKEIHDFVNAEIRRHTAFIQQQLDQIDNNNAD
ncbi:Fic family protein [Lewinella cohaerens]|uniref:Fic family protein n=1 Tax=Lewinella cohaerens TaxID=70995 RepID=UPI00036895DF|nr:Fic family protein [Lewinella cohaerens]